MGATILHDKGVSRVLPQTIRQTKGNWYLGFICPHCETKLCIAEDPTCGRDPPAIVGSGKWSTLCYKCQRDDILLDANRMISIRADEDGPEPRKNSRKKPSGSSRQLLGRSKFSRFKATFGPSFIEDNPECAVIIARCTSTWSYVEVELALLLASVLHIDQKAAAAIFLAIYNSRIQQQVLRAAAEAVISEQDFQVFSAFMNVVATIEKERNDIVHGIFGGSPFVDGLMWCEQKHFVTHTFTVWSSDFKDMHTAEFRSNTFIYMPEDLETTANRIEWLP